MKNKDPNFYYKLQPVAGLITTITKTTLMCNKFTSGKRLGNVNCLVSFQHNIKSDSSMWF